MHFNCALCSSYLYVSGWRYFQFFVFSLSFTSHRQLSFFHGLIIRGGGGVEGVMFDLVSNGFGSEDPVFNYISFSLEF